MRTRTEVKRMIKTMGKEAIRGHHWYNMALRWFLNERQDINGYKLGKNAQKKSQKEKTKLMITYLDFRDVWRKRYFIEPLEWALGDKDDIFGVELPKEEKEMVVFT